MKKLLLLSLLIPSIALSQGWQIPNPAGTPRALPTPGTSMSKANVDIYGNQQVVTVGSGGSGLSQSVVPESGSVGLNGGLVVPQALFLVGTDTIEAASTTTVLNLTSHAARIGDWVTPTGGTAGNINVGIPVCSTTANTVTLCYPLPATPSTDAIKIERPNPSRAVAFNGVQQATDTIPPLVIRNENAAAINTTNLAYGVFSANREGALYTSTSTLFNDANNGKLAVVDEDIAFAPSDALTKVGGQALSAVAQSVGTSGDVAPFAMDLGNRLITSNSPSGEIVVGCNTAIVTATTGTIIAATASKFTFVTSLSCTNTGAAATRVILEDGAGTDLANVLLPATTGFAHVSFPSPVRTSVVNSVIQANVITTSSSTICCASGFVGAI